MTVSRALSGRGRISDSTRERIFHAVDQLGYRASHTARALRTRRTMMVACLLPNEIGDFFGAIHQAIDTYLREWDYEVMLSLTRGNFRRVTQTIERSVDLFDGFVLIPVDDDEVNQICLERIRNAGKPVVVMGPFHDLGVDCVDNDDAETSREIAEFLIRKGHRKIGYTSGSVYRVVGQRIDGFRQAMADRNLAVEEGQVQSGAVDGPTSGYLGAGALLDRHPDVTAIMTDNDETAAGVYRALAERGLKIPEDISVFGFANSTTGAHLVPPVSTVEQFSARLGTSAAHLLAERLSGKRTGPPTRSLVSAKLIHRESVAAVKTRR
jgi:LacI family transcriptional regulator